MIGQCLQVKLHFNMFFKAVRHTSRNHNAMAAPLALALQDGIGVGGTAYAALVFVAAAVVDTGGVLVHFERLENTQNGSSDRSAPVVVA